MDAEDIHSWSKTAAANVDAGWAEGMARAAVNDSSRSNLAGHAKERDRQNGSIVTGGTANAQTFDSGGAYTTIPTGMRVLLKIGPGLTNTGTMTLTMDSISAVTVKTEAGANLAGGELLAGSYVEFLYDGTNWVLLQAVASQIVIQTFVATGTYTPTVGMVYCIIEAVGGGGGGAGSGGGVGYILQGGGGGGGSYARKVASAADIGVSQVVTVGAGGIAGAGTGNNGGETSVGALCIANGGIGATGISNAAFGSGGNGGAVGTGTFTSPGTHGMGGLYFTPSTGLNIVIGVGLGGASYFGGGGRPGVAGDGAAANGVAGTGYGSGGGGACTNNIGTNAVGGGGAAGVVVITEFVRL